MFTPVYANTTVWPLYYTVKNGFVVSLRYGDVVITSSIVDVA